MSVTNYISIESLIHAEQRSTSIRRYGTDITGSVLGTYTNGSVENTYRLSPYGYLLSKSGVAVDPSFLWVGSYGYRLLSQPPNMLYVRKRHLGVTQAIWTSLDPLWPGQRAYAYTGGKPTTAVDPTGLCWQFFFQDKGVCDVDRPMNSLIGECKWNYKYIGDDPDCPCCEFPTQTISFRQVLKRSGHGFGCATMVVDSFESRCISYGVYGTITDIACNAVLGDKDIKKGYDVAKSFFAGSICNCLHQKENSLDKQKPRPWDPDMYVECEQTLTLEISLVYCAVKSNSGSNN